MKNDFQQIVDLKKEKNKNDNLETEPIFEKTIKKDSNKIRKTYNTKNTKQDLQKISQPINNSKTENIYKKFVFILAFALICVVVYFLFFNNLKNNNIEKIAENKTNNWYSIELSNNETYYGQIEDIKADPIIVKNVYYNYDQSNKEENKNNNLRLIKKGKETYGPDGTMNIVRSHVLYMEPLSADSKVLQAILNDNSK